MCVCLYLPKCHFIAGPDGYVHRALRELQKGQTVLHASASSPYVTQMLVDK